MTNTYFYPYDSPIGQIVIEATDEALTHLYIRNDRAAAVGEQKETALIRRTWAQLDEYFRGERRSFDLPLDPAGTVYMRRIWQLLCEIPYGETASYGEIATRAGNHKAARAVGLANNRNPIPILIPCHRVIGKNGSLTGFRGGLDMKQQLLDLEQRYK